MSAESDIARARRKPLPEEKMLELLAKARKGATSSFSFGKLVQILDKLGWEIEPTWGWTPLHYPYQNKEHPVTEWTKQNPSDADVEFAEKQRAKLIDASVDSLPEAGPGTIGERVVMDVGPMQTGSDGIRYFHRHEWVGTEGVKISNPRGEEAEFLPDHHDVERSKCVTELPFMTGNAWRWLKSVGIEGDVSAALGTEKHIPAAQRTRENTGTCAHCWGNYKLEGGRLVLHGYKRPRWGYVVGQCRGRGYEPIEKSPDGAKDQLEQLAVYLDHWKKVAADLKSGKVTEIEVEGTYKKRMVRKGEPSFERHLEDALRDAKRNVKTIEGELDLYEKVVGAWRERPMPKDRELLRGPGFFVK